MIWEGVKKFHEGTSTSPLPVPYFCSLSTIECVGNTVEAQAQKSLSVSGNNYVKVWG